MKTKNDKSQKEEPNKGLWLLEQSQYGATSLRTGKRVLYDTVKKLDSSFTDAELELICKSRNPYDALEEVAAASEHFIRMAEERFRDCTDGQYGTLAETSTGKALLKSLAKLDHLRK